MQNDAAEIIFERVKVLPLENNCQDSILQQAKLTPQVRRYSCRAQKSSLNLGQN